MRVAIIHPWFPQYRLEFFQRLRDLAQEQNITVDIYHGSPPPELKARGDALVGRVSTELPTRYFKIGSNNVGYKSLGTLRKEGSYNLIIAEQAVRNLETYLLFTRRLSKHVAFWGHGRTYTKSVSSMQERIKELLTLRTDWFFAYTEGGRKHVETIGYNPESVTVVNNSINTEGLSNAIASVSSEQIDTFRATWDTSTTTGLFLGGLDGSKRLDFLLESMHRIHQMHPLFTLIVAGDGPARPLVEKAAAEYEYIKYVGPVFGADKAILMASCDMLLMPGRVGLVAVDSFAAGIPIITTDWEYHAPEFEYLQNGVNSLVLPDNLSAYVSGVSALIGDKNLLSTLKDGCRRATSAYTVENMAHNFVRGLVDFKHKVLVDELTT